MADPIIHRLRELAPFADDHEAQRALEATIAAIWAQLFAEERAKLAQDLPSPLAQRMQAPRAEPPRSDSPPTFARHVAHREDITPSLGVEHASVVCRALAEVLPADTRAWLQSRLPELSELFDLPPISEPAPDAP